MEFEKDNMLLSLKGKNILVTGVSRPLGIGAAITTVLAHAGANVIAHGYSNYDTEQQYPDAVTNYAAILANELNEKRLSVTALAPSDLSLNNTPEQVVAQASAKFGYLDGLVLNHAYSVCLPIGEWTAEHIDRHMSTNVRAAMLMIQAFAKQMPTNKNGAITLFTSGQHLGPMTREIAYAVSKEAIIGLCKQAAIALAPQNIRVNCVNPGPTDTGYAEGKAYENVAKMFPTGRWGTPDDAAKLVHFLQSDYARWITGEVISSEGGFRRDTQIE